MSLEKLFQSVDDLRHAETVNAAFGQPQELAGKTIIPVAQVHLGFGVGFGHRAPGEAEILPSQGGSGGRGGVRPVAIVEVTPEETIVRPIVDEGQIVLAVILAAAWVAFWLLITLRAIFGQE